jgi:hypothetical protein
MNTPIKNLESAALKLLSYCQVNNWEGYDPYDALNSKILKRLPFLDFRIFRIVLTQILKRSPVNLRPCLAVPKTQNPKAIALFLMAIIKLQRLGLLENEDLIMLMTRKLIELRYPNSEFWCWGYSFPWQTRKVLVSTGAPNLVCTYFAASALLDVFERNHESDYLRMAASSAEYLLNDLYWTGSDSIACFRYFKYPLSLMPHQVHNVNFLGAALLCRIYNYSGEKKFLEPALKVAQYSATKQNTDGSWNYGEDTSHRWIDNFHTGYNLCSLRAICQYAATSVFENAIRKGFEFYRNHFFREDGASKYYHNRTHPIDIHSLAQSIITLLTLKDLEENNISLAQDVVRWTMNNMWDEKGYFYYQVLPQFTSKIPYMRWSQAWMLLALSTLLEENVELRKKQEASAD